MVNDVLYVWESGHIMHACTDRMHNVHLLEMSVKWTFFFWLMVSYMNILQVNMMYIRKGHYSRQDELFCSYIRSCSMIIMSPSCRICRVHAISILSKLMDSYCLKFLNIVRLLFPHVQAMVIVLLTAMHMHIMHIPIMASHSAGTNWEVIQSQFVPALWLAIIGIHNMYS